MNYDDFSNWLINNKKMNYRSAKDVVSRCRRISKMTKKESILKIKEQELENNEYFCNCSTFVRSQLKRAISLLAEWSHKE